MQETNRDGKISSFIPFFDFDEFRYVPTATSIQRGIGDETLFAYIDGNGLLKELSHSDAQRLGREETTIFGDTGLPILTRMALARLANAPQLTQMECVRQFGERFLKSKISRDVFKISYSKLINERRRFWDKINALDSEEHSRYTSGIFDKINTEDLYRWLFDNLYSDVWISGLAKLLKMVSSDERILDLLTMLLTSEDFYWAAATARERAIIARGVETYLDSPTGHGGFEDVMEEVVLSAEIFDIADTLKSSVVVDFVDHLDHRSKLSSPAIDVYLEGLERDNLTSDLAYQLISVIMQSEHLDLLYKTSDDSFQEAYTRRDRFRDLITDLPRISLVVPASLRADLRRRLRK